MRIGGGAFRGRLLKVPKGEIRPTVTRLRAALFNMCQNDLSGADVLDLFAGSGAIGFEAISRGANTVTFIEKERIACEAIERNREELGVIGSTRILRGDVLSLLPLLERQYAKYDFIYIDPPYGLVSEKPSRLYANAILEFLDRSTLIKANGVVWVEEDVANRSNIDSQQLKSLKKVDERIFGSTLLQKYLLSEVIG